MLRTYSRKLRPAPNGDSVVELYKSSQDSFFDSPNDPYFFDSQTSTTEDTQLQHSNHSSAALAATAEATQLHKICSNQIQSPTAQDSSAASSSRVTQLSAQTAVPLPELPLKRKSRLSQCSSQPLQDDSAATVKANPPTVQAPILPQLMHVKQAIAPQTIVRDSGTTSQATNKRQCLKRVSSSSTSRSRNSSGKATSSVPREPAAPAVTVLEAQESGGHTQIVDDIVYALDGLGRRCSKTSWQDSSSTLAQICASRRGKQAFRVEGLFKETMAAALVLPLQQDPVTALAFAAMLLAFATGDVANRALLSQTQTVQLAAKLLKMALQQSMLRLKVHSACSASTSAERKLDKLLKQGALHTAMAGQGALTPSNVTTRALCIALKPEKSSTASETLKDCLRTEGVLHDLVQAVQYHAEQTVPAASCSDEPSDEELNAINHCLTALEHASFACPGNEQYLVSLQMLCKLSPHQESGCPPGTDDSQPQAPGSAGESFPAYLTRLISQTASSASTAVTTESKHASLRRQQDREWICTQAGLSVLVNITHHNASGCEAVADAGGLQMAASMLSSCLQPVQSDDCCADGSDKHTAQIARDRQHAVSHVSTLTAALGLLINLLESSDTNRKKLKDMQIPSHSSSGTVLQLLCRLMQASAADSKVPSGSQQSSQEVTEQHMADNEDNGNASIIEVYSALLLGFLLAGDERSQAEVSNTLGSLNPVIASIRRCLGFYVDAGALTSQSEESLRKLLAALCHTGCDD